MSEPGTRLFVGNLSWNTTDQTLFDAFNESVGDVVEAKVICDKYSGRSRGFGFVTFSSPEVANSAIEKMNGFSLDSRDIRVDVASSQRR
ncbi:unnamed protein product [Agarophyton chilense]